MNITTSIVFVLGEEDQVEKCLSILTNEGWSVYEEHSSSTERGGIKVVDRKTFFLERTL